jgi:polar amino acid transport system permease protein
MTFKALPLRSALTLLALALAAAWVVYAFQREGLYHWQWASVWPYLPVIGNGVLLTLETSALSVVVGFLLGLGVALMRISSDAVLRWTALAYIEVIRNTPLMVQILIVYFGLGSVFEMDRFTAAVLSLSVFSGAYVAEILRASIEAVPRGQSEAARSLGMTHAQTMTYVIFPQALRISLPPLAGQFISLVKDSSLLSIISIAELTMSGREVVTVTFRAFEVYLLVALLYFALTFPLSLLTRYMEGKLKPA